MKILLLLGMTWTLFPAQASMAGEPALPRHPKRAFCKQDLSAIRLPFHGGGFPAARSLKEHAVRPGLLHVQQELCRCLPRRKRRLPAEVDALLHIQPNAGVVTIHYTVAPSQNRGVGRMMACLGQPTLTVQPIRYVSDIVTKDGKREVLRYPLKVSFAEK